MKLFRILLFTGIACAASMTNASTTNAPINFQDEYQMNAALDVGQDVGMEQVNFSRNAGIKKAQEYLHGISNEARMLMRHIETTLDGEDGVEIPSWVDSWGRAERIQVRISGLDNANTVGIYPDDFSLNKNTTANVVFKFAKEHHVSHVDDIAFRFVPVLSVTQDGEFSVQGWYCETDIDWVDFTKNWEAPADEGVAAVGQAVKGQRSMITRSLAYPFSNCVVAQNPIDLPTDGTQAGIADGDIDTDEAGEEDEEDPSVQQ